MRTLPVARLRARGFTMLELVVTIALTSTMFALLLPWVLNLIGVSASNLDTSTAARSAASVARTLDKDLAAALVCPATGSPVHASTSTTFALFATTGPDSSPGADPHLVVWTMNGGDLLRTAIPAELTATACGSLDPDLDPVADAPSAQWVTYATGVTTSPGGGGSLRMFSDQVATSPRLVSVDLRIASPDGGSATAPVTASYTLPFFYAGVS